jgi:hypothetical protein
VGIELELSEFRIELERARDRFYTGTGRIIQLSFFADYAPIVFRTYRGRMKYLSDFTAEKIKDFTEAFPDLRAYTNKYGPREGLWRWMSGLPRKANRLLYQQLVVFLVTIFEAFLQDVLLLVFRREPRCLSSGKTTSWERVIELGDYDSVINYFASERISDILSGDWDKIVREFDKLFNINLSSEIDGKSIAEIFEIRHAIVHSVGVADQRFVDKVQVSEWGLKYSLNREIVVNRKALNGMTSYVEYAVLCIYDSILNKFGSG